MTRPLRPGDGIIHLWTGNFHFIKAITTRGENQYGRDPNEVLGYVVDRPFGVITLYHGQYRRATFMEYVNNDTGFGKTNWLAAHLIHGFGALSILYSFAAGPWALLGLMAPAGLWLGTWKNWRGRWV